jgi:hypothetical protein
MPPRRSEPPIAATPPPVAPPRAPGETSDRSAFRNSFLTALVLGCALSGAAQAADAPRPGLTDPRIRTVAYNPDQVVRLTGYFGIQTMLEFADDERIENVSIGDALGWQVTPNKKANLLFLKPLDRMAATNMTVVTDRRRYVFELVVAPPKASTRDLAYVVRFLVPQAAPDDDHRRLRAFPAPIARNSAYSLQGPPPSSRPACSMTARRPISLGRRRRPPGRLRGRRRRRRGPGQRRGA